MKENRPNFDSANGIWGLIWCLVTLVCFALVVFAMIKSNKVFILPALIICPINIIVGVIQTIIAFVSLWIFS